MKSNESKVAETEEEELLKAFNIEPIYAFTNSGFSGPRNPRADLIPGRDGNFYGTPEYGGSGGFGTVFKVTTSGVMTVLGNFDSFNTGGDPYGGVTFGPDGNLYGTTYFSGPGGVGTVFRVTTNGVVTRFYSFTSTTWNGSNLHQHRWSLSEGRPDARARRLSLRHHFSWRQ